MEELSKPASTKERIVKEAANLFGKFGYDGTSIRDIAKQANVNVAAINYHFVNKQNLYKEILTDIFNRTNQMLITLAHQGSWNLQSFTIELFTRLTNQDDDLFNNIKIFITPSPTGPQIINEHGMVAIPGEEAYETLIQNDYPSATSEDKNWVASIVLRQLVQTAMLVNYSASPTERAGLREKEKRTIARLVTVAQRELTTSH